MSTVTNYNRWYYLYWDFNVASTLVSVNTAHEIDILESSSYSNFPWLLKETLTYFFSLVPLWLLFFIMIWSEAIKEHGSINTEGNNSVSYGILFDKTADTRE